MVAVFPAIAYGTPRKLPSAHGLEGRVVVLDIAFAANVGGASFEKVTLPFIRGLGDRLAMWIDHHDHARHADFADDARFVLATKAEHPACPEMVTPARVDQAGPVDTLCCHVDFDGLCAAAKWIRGGREPYEGADEDARAIDTRLGEPSPRARTIDRALRAKPRDDAMRHRIVRYLAQGGRDKRLWGPIAETAQLVAPLEQEAERLAVQAERQGNIAVCDARRRRGPYDKTTLLLLLQKQAPLSLVHDESTVTVAAAFDSGINLLTVLGINGGMPTRVSVAAKDLDRVLERLRAL